MKNRLTLILTLSSALWLFGLTAKAQSSGPTIGNSVYGGGKGSSATVTGAVLVEVNAGTVGTTSPSVGIGDVYGGGKQANVVGSTTVNLKGGTVFGDLYGGGALANVSGNTTVTTSGGSTRMVFGGGMGNDSGTSAQVSGTTEVNINEGSTVNGKVITTVGTSPNTVDIRGAVFGGCNVNGSVGNTIAVNADGGSVNGNVYGGGLGSSTTTGAGVTVTVDGASVTGDVYGGSALGQVNDDNTEITKVWLKSGSVSNIYGGGMGQTGASAENGQVNGSVQVLVDGGTVTDVFGCNNYNGAPQGTVQVNINSAVAQNVFGGGNLAAYAGTPDVNINAGIVSGSVFGGGNEAGVGGGDVTMIGGNVLQGVYGGCNTSGTVSGPITVVLSGGKVGTDNDNRADVYGGGYGGYPDGGTVGGTFTNGDITVTLQNTAEVYGDLYGGSAFGSVNGNTSTTTVNLLNSDKLHGKVFGGGKGQTVSPAYTATTNGNVEVNIEAANTNGNLKGIYGGANVKGNIVGDIDVNIKANVGGSGANLDTIFGGGLGAATTTEGDITVTVDKLNSSSPAPVLYGDVYGGSALGIVGNDDGQDTTKVAFKKGTLHGKIYGGGMGDSSDSTKVLGAVLVEITDGTIDSCIYGGCNYKGGVAGKVTINVKGGTIGSHDNLFPTPSSGTPILANVFGGGFGELTTTLGDVEVNIGEFKYNDDNKEIHSDVPAIYGDVYGGSALGTVNTAGGTNTTIVNIKNGNLVTNKGTENGFPSYRGGNVFGGGLGEAGADNASKGQVNGAVTVNIGTGTLADNNPDITMPTEVHGKASIGGNVYGCNNTNGSPKKGVLVNVFQTHHTATDSATYVIPANHPTAPSTLTYAIQNVFGGGNKANFLENKDAYVRIYTCDNTVQRVFGGGNAAATNSVTTMIQGGRFAEVFGGGNGEVTAADVNGTVTLNIHGGDIGDIFGGSNQNGTITGGSTISIDDSGPCGSVDVDEFFCGGKYADFVGDIDATITCAEGMTVKNLYGGCKEADVVPNGDDPTAPGYKPGNVHLSVYGGTFQNVYGGSKGSLPPANATPVQLAAASADIAGNVTLDIYGGTIDTVFGGNNVFGNIFGKIVVNIMDDGSGDGCPLVVHNVYGGGRDAAYTPSATVASTGSYPEVNIIHGRVSLKPQLNQDGDTVVISGQPVYIGGGKVFGGGYGQPAIVSHNPKVRIGYDASMADYLVGYGIAENLRTATVDSLVFGGGDRAPVAGSTSVTIQKASSSALGLFGGGNMASVGNATVNVLDGIVTAGVYGGCNVSGTVGGTIDSLTFAQGVNSEHKKYLEIDTIHSSFDGTIAVNLNGGTVGVDGTTTDVVFGGGYGHNTSTTGNVGVTLGTAANSGTTVYGNLYGGSALGSVNAGTGNTTTVTLTSATLYGSVFGGGMGSGSVEATKATSLGNATVNINVHDTNLTGIYGGANVNGDVEGNINVNVKANVGSSGTNGNLDVFGGGYGQYTSTGGDVTVNVGYESTSPIIYGDVYGGSSLGQVNASSNNKTIVNFLNGTLNGTVYGGGKGQTSPNPIAAWVNGDVEVAVSDGTILGTLISGSTYGAVFGGCNVNGVVSGNAIVGFTGGTVGSSGTHANVYGGGLGQNTTVQGSVGMNLGSSTILGDVYGGSAKGKVNYNYNSSTPPYSVNDATGVATTVTLGGASVTGNLYGGGHGLDGALADVGRAVFVNVNSGSVNTYGTEGANGGNVFGCNNVAGSPKDSVLVIINNNVTKNVYGGGNLAAYSAPTATPNYPKVNVNHGTMANVFGGGLGSTAGVTGNPKVTIGDSESSHKAIITGNVYGGGDLAAVTGNTNVIYCDNHSESHITNIYGGGNEANVSGSTAVSMTDGYVNEEVYGGGALANVGTNTSVTLSGGSVRMAFGGGMGSTTQAALVERNAVLTLSGATLRGNTINTSGTAVKGGAFGGCNIKGTVKGSATVEITNATGASDNHVNIYGGGLGENTNVQGSVAVNVGANVFGDVYGGSAKGLVNYDDNTPTNPTTGAGITTSVTLTGGTVTGDVYGGGHGLDEQLANVGREVVVSVNGGTVSGYGTGNADGGNVFGCNNLLGAPQNAVTVNISNNVAHNVYGGGNQAAYTYTTDNNPTVNILAGSVGLNVFGGGLGQTAQVTGNPVVYLNGGTVTGHTFGGGSAAPVSGNPSVYAYKGKTTNAYGGGLGSTAAVTGNPTAVVNKTDGQTLTVTDVFGGGDAAPVTGNTTVQLLAGTIRDGFGGGNVAIITGTTSVSNEGATARNLYGGGNRADVTSTTAVTVSSGNVSTGVYGGCNTTGTVGGNITVNVTGGQVGTDRDHLAYGVFGGGYGNSTYTGADVTVTVGNADGGPTIYGDVYGGSAQGNVNNTTTDLTKVWLKKGTIIGDVYGGGFGDANQSALVKGKVQVVVDGGTVDTVNTATVGGRVFGCNNKKGTPQGTVEVTVNATNPTTINNGAKVYALKGVYGGGNLAAYTPTPPYSSGTPVYPIVTVNGCASSVKDVYGGGNAAPVPNAKVIINGGDISRVFAGGNGESGTPAHIGWNTTDEITSSTPSSLSYGTGIASAEINGGTILQVFGGSNANGTIRESSTLDIDKSGSCAMKIGEVYGGGNEADGKAGTIAIGCTGDWTSSHNSHNSTNNRIGYELEGIGTVYGGANKADVSNGIDLTIVKGIIENVFGGNNTSGTISDTIRVTINKTGDCGWYVGNVYGGGNLAKYSAPSGKPNYPKVRVLNGTVSEDVFGGGLGNTGDNGKVTGNPQVIVNGSGAAVNGGVYGGGSLAPTQGDPLVTQTLGATAKVFGGGKAASVTGAPTVNIDGGSVSTGVYGGCDSQGNVSGNITVNVTGGTIGSQANLNQATPVTADVYGGGFGESTTTSGNVDVNIGALNLDGTHNEFPKIYGDVYGGSALGNVNTNYNNRTTVNILNGTLETKTDTIRPTSSTYYVNYYGGNVFGGGLGRKDDPSTGDANEAIEAKVNGVVTVNIGAPSTNGRDLNPDDDVNRGMATIQGNVYGCNNTNGSPQDSVMVHIYRTYRADDEQINYSGNNPKYAIANVFGGGNEADYVPLSTAAHKKLKVMIHGCYNSVRRVFGGSNAAASGNSLISTTVSTNIDGGRFYQVFGGGNGEVSAANIYGDLDLRIHGGIVEQFYGASNQNGTITGNINTLVDNTSGCESIQITEYFCGGNYSNVYGDLVSTITCSDGLNVTSLYGGCNQANIYGDVVLNLCGGTYTNVFGGSKGVAGGISADILAVTQAVHDAHPEVPLTVGHGGNITLNLYGGTIENVFGGSNINGKIEGNITVNVIDAESTTCPLYVTNIYGGSNLTDYVPDSVNHVAVSDPDRISPVVNLVHAKYGISGNVYGGSKGNANGSTITKVMANPRVNIGYDATSMNGYIPATYLSSHPDWLAAPRAIVAGSVFGGGDAARVVGNTAIFLRNRAKVFGNVYGGGNMGEVTGNTKVIVNGANQ